MPLNSGDVGSVQFKGIKRRGSDDSDPKDSLINNNNLETSSVDEPPASPMFDNKVDPKGVNMDSLPINPGESVRRRPSAASVFEDGHSYSSGAHDYSNISIYQVFIQSSPLLMSSFNH